MNRIFLAGLLGGIAMYVCVYISYSLTPLGWIGIRKLPNETAVLDALQKNIAENSGLYFFPPVWPKPNPPEKKAEARNNFVEKMARYPSGILMYNAAGSRPAQISRWQLVEFLTDLAQAFLAVLLLSLTRLTTFGARVGFVLLVGVLAAIATNVGYWNWNGFPLSVTLVSIFIQIVEFLCAGLVAAFVLKKQTFGVTSAPGFWSGMWRAILGS